MPTSTGSTTWPFTIACPSFTLMSIGQNLLSHRYRSTPSVASGRSACGLSPRRARICWSSGAFTANWSADRAAGGPMKRG